MGEREGGRPRREGGGGWEKEREGVRERNRKKEREREREREINRFKTLYRYNVHHHLQVLTSASTLIVVRASSWSSSTSLAPYSSNVRLTAAEENLPG